MSYTTLYLVPENGGIEDYAEYRNAFGSAAYVWSAMAKKYHGEEFLWLSNEDVRREVWGLSKRADVPDFVRITMMTTFDKVMVKSENLLRVVEAFKEFVKAYPPGNSACSLLEQAGDLENLADDPHCYAVCWNQTSVGEAWPYIYEGDDDDEDDEGRPYDISKDKGHWFLFDQFERYKTAEQPEPQPELKRWWVSWEEPTGMDGDYRPISVPVPPAVKRWWCSGHGEGYATLCAVVDAPSEADAMAAIEDDWKPQAWRFCTEHELGWRPNPGRFPWD